MKVSEVKQILNSPKMQNRNTNFKLLKTSTGGGSRGPKQPTTRDLILKNSKLILQIADRLDKFIVKQEKFNAKQEKFNKQTNKKFDLIFAMLKKHKWVK